MSLLLLTDSSSVDSAGLSFSGVTLALLDGVAFLFDDLVLLDDFASSFSSPEALTVRFRNVLSDGCLVSSPGSSECQSWPDSSWSWLL